MTGDSLLAYWTKQLDMVNKELTDARSEFTMLQNDLNSQKASLSKANQELADLADQNKKIRADMTIAATTADIHALELDLNKTIKNTHSKQAEINEIEASVEAVQTKLNQTNSKVSITTNRVSSVMAALEAIDRDKDRIQLENKQATRSSGTVTISNLNDHPFLVNDKITLLGMADSSFNGAFEITAVTDTTVTYPQNKPAATSGGGVIFGQRLLRLRHKLAESPLSDLPDKIGNAFDNDTWANATTKIESDFPQELRDCANERASVILEGLASNQMKIKELNELSKGLIDEKEYLSKVFNDAEANFKSYIFDAKESFDRAMVIAERVGDKKQNVLTEAEILNIQGKKSDGSDDKDLQENRKEAAAARQAVATAQVEVINKQTELDIAIMKALVANIDKNPNTDDEVKDAKEALKKAQSDLAGKQKDFTPEDQTVLSEWEIAVPQTAWNNLYDYVNAERLINDLQKKKPEELTDVMDTAEADLVASLQTADKVRKTLDFIRSENEKVTSSLNFDTGILSRRLLSALRGDN